MTSGHDAPGLSWRRLPKLLRFLGLHLAAGAALGAAFASALASSNIFGLNDLLAGTEQPAVALFMLYAVNILTFGSLAMGAGVMLLPMGTPCDMRERADRDT